MVKATTMKRVNFYISKLQIDRLDKLARKSGLSASEILRRVCGDGDFLMSCTALWTAVHYRIPLLIVVANNRSFYNDEVHQERVAVMRKRPVENKWIGQRMGDPEIDLAQMAKAQGAHGFGPVTKVDDLPAVFAKAIAAVEAGGVAVVDVRVKPGYGPNVARAMTRQS